MRNGLRAWLLLAACPAVLLAASPPAPGVAPRLRPDREWKLSGRLDRLAFVADALLAPDGRLLATEGSEGVRLWRVRDSTEYARLSWPWHHEYTRLVPQLAFSPTGKVLAVGHRNFIRLVEVASARERWRRKACRP